MATTTLTRRWRALPDFVDLTPTVRTPWSLARGLRTGGTRTHFARLFHAERGEMRPNFPPRKVRIRLYF